MAQGEVRGGGSAPPRSSKQARRSALREALAVYGGVLLGSVALTWLQRNAGGWIADLATLALALLLLGAATRAAGRHPGGVQRLGFALGGLLDPDACLEGPAGPLRLWETARLLARAVPSALRETAVALAVMAAVAPPFVVGFRWWHGAAHPWRWNPPEPFGSFVLTQLLVVALPEEVFFRGYLQGRLAEAWPRRVRLLGVRLPLVAWLVQAALFALLHFAVEPYPQRLAVFFPALLFGWVRAWRGGVGAAIVLHAASNVLSELLGRGWLLWA